VLRVGLGVCKWGILDERSKEGWRGGRVRRGVGIGILGFRWVCENRDRGSRGGGG
jgi:hypothetical protein